MQQWDGRYASVYVKRKIDNTYTFFFFNTNKNVFSSRNEITTSP